MQIIKLKQLLLKTLIMLLSVVVLGGFLPVNPGSNPLLEGGEAWAGSLGAQPGVGTSAGIGGGAVGAGAGAPARGAAGAPATGVGTNAGGGAVGAGAGAPARGAAGTPVAAPRGYVR